MLDLFVNLLIALISFFIGGAYIQVKEVNFGIEAEHDCNKCLAQGCQGKYCYTKRIQNKKENKNCES